MSRPRTTLRMPTIRRGVSCRFHGRAWSKTCQECLACLERGAGPKTIVDLVRRRARIRTALVVAPLTVAAGIAIGWWLA